MSSAISREKNLSLFPPGPSSSSPTSAFFTSMTESFHSSASAAAAAAAFVLAMLAGAAAASVPRLPLVQFRLQLLQLAAVERKREGPRLHKFSE